MKIVRCLLIVGVLMVPLLFLRPASADIGSCSASVSPSSLDPNVTVAINFSVENTDENDILWVRISVPSGQYNLINGSASGWSRSVDGSSVSFTGGTLPAGSSADFSVTVQTAVYPSAAEIWPVSASDTSEGDTVTRCTGDTGVAVGGDVEGPVFSDIRAINVTSTEATISWTTDENATSKVRYGGSIAYETTVSDNSLVTGHTMNLSGLTPGTTYHYQVEGTDDTGNTSTSTDKIFTTASFSASPSPSTQVLPPQSGGGASGNSDTSGDSSGSASTEDRGIVATPTVPSSVADQPSLPSPSPIAPVNPIDAIPPIVLLTTSLEKPFAQSPALSGLARDNTGVQSVYYSTDDGRNWLPVTLPGSAGNRQVSFRFNANLSEDDDYLIRVKAVDQRGNVGVSRGYRLVLDTMPPVMGPAVYVSGSQIQNPYDGSDSQVLLMNVDQKVVVSALGGPIEMDIVARSVDTKEDASFTMEKTINTGWWTGVMRFSTPGIYDAFFHAKDGAGNEASRAIGRIRVVEGGTVYHQGRAISGARVEVWQKNGVTDRFEPWSAEAFGQVNPQSTSQSGGFGYILPAGTYYLSVQKDGLRPVKTQIFTLEKSTALHPRINMTTLRYVSLGLVDTPYPPLFWPEIVAVNIYEERPKYLEIGDNDDITTINADEVLLHSMDNVVKLSDLRQDKLLVTVMAQWSPQTSEQLSQMSALKYRYISKVVPVFLQSTPESTALFKKKGEYTVNIWADPDGALANAIKADSLIFHVLVAPDGTIIKEKHGVLSIGQMEEMLE